MRVRTNLIIEESVLAKIDAIAGEKAKRTEVINRALLEFIAREESKAPAETEAKDKKPGAKAK